MNISERLQNLTAPQRASLAQQLNQRVSANASGGPQKRLVAYVVLSPGEKAVASDLREFLGAKLPDYMRPSAFVFLESLPQTPNGKIDRNALPAPESIRVQTEKKFVAPRTPVEEKLAAIWAEVLRVEKVSIDENFFDLGGHSLLAIQVMARVRESFQVEIPLRSLFEALTVESLAEVIVHGMLEKADESEINQILADDRN
jgi:acyl carrier protein